MRELSFSVDRQIIEGIITRISALEGNALKV